MELRHLRVFCVLAEELHFGRAAKRLHTAQSAVSQTLRDLEEEVDARLIERSTRSVKLTDAGQALVSYAREALETVERGAAAARTAHEHSGRLKVRVLASTGTARLPKLLAHFHSKYPLVALEVSDGSSAQNLAALESAYCDIALTSLASRRRLSDTYESVTLESSRLAVVVSRTHRLARKKRVELRDLAGEPYLSMHRAEEPDVRDLLDAKLAAAGALPTSIVVSHPRALVPLIAAGLGIAVLPELMLEGTREAVVAVPIAGMSQHGGVLAVWNKRRTSAAAKHFIALLRS